MAFVLLIALPLMSLVIGISKDGSVSAKDIVAYVAVP
jgi:hypothetical protein